MKQIFLMFVFLFSILVPSANAQTADYWHTSDIYNVELDGEGDAFVVETIVLESISSNNVSSIVR